MTKLKLSIAFELLQALTIENVEKLKRCHHPLLPFNKAGNWRLVVMCFTGLFRISEYRLQKVVSLKHKQKIFLFCFACELVIEYNNLICTDPSHVTSLSCQHLLFNPVTAPGLALLLIFW